MKNHANNSRSRSILPLHQRQCKQREMLMWRFTDIKGAESQNIHIRHYVFDPGSWPWSPKISLLCVAVSHHRCHSTLCCWSHEPDRPRGWVSQQLTRLVVFYKDVIVICSVLPSVIRLERYQHVYTQKKSEIAVGGSVSLWALSNSLSCQNSSAMPSFSLN